jgi:hypothetical protein
VAALRAVPVISAVLLELRCRMVCFFRSGVPV